MQNIFRFTSTLVILAVVSGCQTLPYQPYAREVKKKPSSSGLIALRPEHRDEDRAKAQSMMQSNCGGSAVKILEEGEIVVGTNTVSNAQETKKDAVESTKVGSLFGIPLTSGGSEASNNTATTATTTAVKEWNISYECEKSVASSRGGVKK